ncbi:Phospholipase D [Bertholletia excelsa]
MEEAEPAQRRTFYLHGDLDLKIKEARDLPNMDIIAKNFRSCVAAFEACRPPPPRTPPSGSGDRPVGHHRKIITSDPYVTVRVPYATLARTRVIPNSQNPNWNDHFNIALAHPVENLEFHVKDNDLLGAELIGKVLIPAERLAGGERIRGWFSVTGAKGKPPKPDTALYLEMQFTPCEKNPLYEHARDGINHTYFPLRRGSSVKLYQDAHISKNVKLPEIELDGGITFERGKCWEDICYAISEAHHLIYLVGWSIFHKVKLIREPTMPRLPRGGDLILGDLLKYKSEEGVRVLLLVWDDKTSQDKMFLNTVRNLKLMVLKVFTCVFVLCFVLFCFFVFNYLFLFFFKWWGTRAEFATVNN